MSTEPSAAEARAVIGELSAGNVPFAVLYRPHSTVDDVVEVLAGAATPVATLAELSSPAQGTGQPAHDLLALIPFRQIAERGYASKDDGTPLVALRVNRQHRFPRAAALSALPDRPIELANADFDTADDEYVRTVQQIIADEIGRGAGSNFVIRRSFVAEIKDFSVVSALAMLRRLITFERGGYWTFLLHTGSRTLVGATPERHLSLVDGVATMNPISGTFRYPARGPRLNDVLEFLADRKEIDELYMVLDEELKMMARICDGGGRVTGPFLKEMARVAHTEYLIEGTTTKDAREILRETMFAPTVTGSPLENACRVIADREPGGRGYYGGVLALIGRDHTGRQTLDSAILIRTADIDRDGRMELGAGATIVRHSDPVAEAEETRGKAAGLVAAATHGPEVSSMDTVPPRFAGDPLVRRALAARNQGLAAYWFDVAASPPVLGGHRVLVIDAEDMFTAMLALQLRWLGLDVTVRGYAAGSGVAGQHLVVLGPGPGDPTDGGDPRIATMRRLAAELLRGDTPFLAICLGHQVLAGALGLDVVRRTVPNQGVQRVIDLFGHQERVGFYNTFTALSDRDHVEHAGVGGVDISRDIETGEVYATRGRHFRSFQFHPESVLTEHGVGILAGQVAALLASPGGMAGAEGECHVRQRR